MAPISPARVLRTSSGLSTGWYWSFSSRTLASDSQIRVFSAMVGTRICVTTGPRSQAGGAPSLLITSSHSINSCRATSAAVAATVPGTPGPLSRRGPVVSPLSRGLTVRIFTDTLSRSLTLRGRDNGDTAGQRPDTVGTAGGHEGAPLRLDCHQDGRPRGQEGAAPPRCTTTAWRRCPASTPTSPSTTRRYG